eukprot:NODE_548_length_1360_cov_413.200610_g424_i0.p8 GENE.NODE_548_length_1360_cov_413.200610_g424_i0~~NODE_548_length_1360_cov_413.200610_g424_i0.p8  ORF type:complete len:66 (-),score=6.01 NODE_548_length_1360_cov_413.200610_g424_i0:255-452(-)
MMLDSDVKDMGVAHSFQNLMPIARVIDGSRKTHSCIPSIRSRGKVAGGLVGHFRVPQVIIAAISN